MTEEINIETGVPIPERASANLVIALREMNNGDSFVTARSSASVYSTAKLANVKVTTRLEDRDADPPTRRVWKVADLKPPKKGK